jgi:glycosyltransferase involved in cell wall biosynthesis
MRICLVSSGLEERNRRLQPWRYLFETASALAGSGHDVHLVSDGHPRLPENGDVIGLPVTRLASVRDGALRVNTLVVRAVTGLQPDVVLWHLGATSFLHLCTLNRIPAPVIGVFTSPTYRARELLRLGVLQLLQGYRLTTVHLLGLLVPGVLVHRVLHQGLIEQLVVECETTRIRLTERGVPSDRIHVVRTGVDPVWFETALSPVERARTRKDLEFSGEDFVVGYFGPPTPLRGLPALVRAVALAREKNPRIRLLVLSRRPDGELYTEQQAIERLMARLQADLWAHIVTGLLPQRQLIQAVAMCDVIALPFELVPSDVPLSVLEAMALGVPVITTQVACLPELTPKGTGLCPLPGDLTALVDAIHTLAADTELRQRLGRMCKEQAAYWGACGKDKEIWDTLVRQQAQPQ